SSPPPRRPASPSRCRALGTRATWCGSAPSSPRRAEWCSTTPKPAATPGRRAAEIIARLAHSKAADPGLATADEESGRAAFQGARGGFMTNWAYIYGAASEAVASGTLRRAVLDD